MRIVPKVLEAVVDIAGDVNVHADAAFKALQRHDSFVASVGQKIADTVRYASGAVMIGTVMGIDADTQSDAKKVLASLLSAALILSAK